MLIEDIRTSNLLPNLLGGGGGPIVHYTNSVTWLGDFFHFWQLFKAFGNN